MKHIASKHTLSRTLPRVFVAFALFLGTFAVTRTSNAQSASLINDLKAATGSTSSSGTFLLSIATSVQLSQAVLAESAQFTNSTVNLATEDSDVAYILSNLPATVTTKKGSTPLPSDANFYPTLIADIFGPGAVSAGVLTTSSNAASIAGTISSNARLLGAVGGDAGEPVIAYYIGVGLDGHGASTATPSIAAAVAANLTSTGAVLTYYQGLVGIDAVYQAAGVSGADNPGLVPLVANAIAFQAVGANYTPTVSGEASLAETIAATYKQPLQTGTFVEQSSLASVGLSSSAANIAYIYATDFAAYAPQVAAQATLSYNTQSPAISGSVTNAVPAFATLISISTMNALGTSGSTYAAQIAYSIDTAPNLATAGTKTFNVESARETVGEDVISLAPLQAAAVSGTVAAALTTVADRPVFAYYVASELAGLMTVNGVTFTSSTELNETPAITQAIEQTIPNDSLQAYYAALVATDAVYPVWISQYGAGKTAALPAWANTPGTFYSNLALAAAQAQVSGSNLGANIQAAIAGGVVELFAATNSVATLTATTVEQNALAESTTLTAPVTAATFASNAFLGPQAPYLAKQGVIQYASSPTAVALISGTVASVQPAYAPVEGLQVALVTATSNYVAVATAIATSPGVTNYSVKVGNKVTAKAESTRELLAQDMVAANPTADAAGVDVLVAAAVGTTLTSDADRALLAFFLSDQEGGINGYYAVPTGGTVLNLPSHVALITGALANEANTTGATLLADEELLAVDAAYPFSALDTGALGNPNPAPFEPYIAGIVDAVVGATVSGSNLGISNEAAINTHLVGTYGTELSGSVGSMIVSADLGTTLGQNPVTTAPTVAYQYTFSLFSPTYANPIAIQAATGQNPYLSGSIGAAVAAGAQYIKNFNIGTTAVAVAQVAAPITAGITALPDATLAQTELNDTAALVAGGFAANSSATGLLVSGTYNIYNAYDVMVSGSLASLVSGQYNRAGAGIAAIFTNQISAAAFSTAQLTIVKQIAEATAKFDPAGAGDIVGYVLASIESALNTNPTPYTSSSTWATNFSAAALAIKNAVLAAGDLTATEISAVNNAFSDMTIGSPTGAALVAKNAYLAGDWGVITFNETPVVDQ